MAARRGHAAITGILNIHHYKELGMPIYSVWYRDIEEPLEFATTTRTTETAIVERILAHEKIAAPVRAGGTVSPSVTELIALNKLGTVRYTEDESEMNVIK